MSGASLHRHGSTQTYATPVEFIRAVEAKWGKLEVDLAATEDNAKCAFYLTPEMDSLTCDWYGWLGGGIGWLNPPYDPVTRWVKKCAEESVRGARIITLIRGSIDANWWWDWVHPYAAIYALDRIRFEGCRDVYPSALVIATYGLPFSEKYSRWSWKAVG